MIRELVRGLVVAGLTAATPVIASTDPITSFPPEWPHAAPWKLNRELLLPETQRILFVVDVPRGAQPRPEALDHLAAIAAKYGQREASWVRLGDAGSPSIRWMPSSHAGNQPPLCARRHPSSRHALSPDEADILRLANEVPFCPDGELPADTSYVFVRYVGGLDSAFAETSLMTPDASCGSRTLPVIRVPQTCIARSRPPLFSQAYFEMRALAHEYGHVLGLGSNPGHGRWESRIPYMGGAHCIHRECALALPSATAMLKGQMQDYCAVCKRDIEQARKHWLTGEVFPEVPRLPQPDPAAHVARLKDYNFRQGGQAERLCGYGKAVMPALMTRLPELPGKTPNAPREHATRIVLRILSEEDARRRDEAARDVSTLDAGDRTSDELLRWWGREQGKFQEGDEWTLPRVLEAKAR